MGPNETDGEREALTATPNAGGRVHPRSFDNGIGVSKNSREMARALHGHVPDFVLAERAEMGRLNDSVAGSRFEVVTGSGQSVSRHTGSGACVKVNVVPVEIFGSRCCIPLHAIPRSAALLMCDTFNLDARVVDGTCGTYMVGDLVLRQMERDDTLVLNIIRL